VALTEEARMVMMLEAMGQLLSQEVECGGNGRDCGFMMMKCAYDSGVLRDGDLGKQLQGAVDERLQVGVSPFFESQQAVGEIIPAGGRGEVVAQVVMRVEVVVVG